VANKSNATSPKERYAKFKNIDPHNPIIWNIQWIAIIRIGLEIGLKQ
jgi:hypothetical protein